MNQRSGLTSLAGQVRAAGRGRDTVLAHITPEEAALLKARGGRGSINPVTGLPEFEDEYSYSYDPGPSYSYDPGPSYSYDYSTPSYDYGYSTPSYDYSTPSYDYGYTSPTYSWDTLAPIDYSYLNPVVPSMPDYSTPDYGYDYSTPTYDYTPSVPDYSTPTYDYGPSIPDYSTPTYDYAPPEDYTTPTYDYAPPAEVTPIAPPDTGTIVSPTTPETPDVIGGPAAPEPYVPPTTEPAITPTPEPITPDLPFFTYADPTANLRSDILGGFTPDAFYRSQYAPEFANEIYSNINPSFSVDEQGNPVEANAPTTGDVTTAPLAGDFVDAQGNLTREGLAPEVTPTVEDNLADLPSENAAETAGRLEFMSPKEQRALAARSAMESEATSLKDLIDESARAAGTDPRTMYGIVKGESLRGDRYDTNITKKEESYGPFQLNRMGGLGAVFEKETGLDLADPKTIPAQTRWVAEYLAQNPNMNVGKTWYGYKGDSEWGDKWGNAGLTPPSVPLPTPRPSDAEFQAYNNRTPPALPTMITGVGNSAYNLPQGAMSYAGQPAQAGETPDANAVTSPSLMDRAIKAAPGAAVDLGLGTLIPFYGPASLAAKVFGIETPGSMIGSNLTGGFANYPGSATATEYVPPVEAPAEIGTLPKTAGGTPIISYPAEGPVQVPGANVAPSSIPYSAPFGTGTYALPGGQQGMSYNAPGSPGADIVSALAEPSDGAPVAKEYQIPFAAPDRTYVLPEELAFAGAPENPSPLEYQPPGQSYELPGYLAKAGEPQPYSPPYQPIDKRYVLPEELASVGKPATPSPLDYANPSTKYVLPPSAGGVSPPGLTRSLPVEQQRIPAPGPMALPSSGGYTPSGGGISGLSGGGGGGGGTNVSIGGGGGGAAKPTATSGSLGSVAARNFEFQGIAGAGRQFGSPVVQSGRTVDFGQPSRQLAYDLNLPAIQQAAVNPNSYRNYLSQYKQLFG